ncbi:MAG: translation initiation factor IF-2 N-terminal domain-containing protein [Campylobacterota bacterium]|nr:translation initiation factor IF-2 N-terminal domain-containing protein [Campylobacterota bacterium]
MDNKVRVFEMADEAGATSTEVIKKAAHLGFTLKSPQSTVSFENAEEITKYILTGKSNKLLKDKKTAIKIMESWFRENYGEPINLLPYDSKKGGYISIFGELKDPYDVLSRKYNDIFHSSYIKGLSEKLHKTSPTWSPLPKEDHYTNEYIKEIKQVNNASNIIKIFDNSIHSIESISMIKIPDKNTQKYMNYMIYANIFTALETLLSDIFYFYIVRNSDYQRQFIEQYDVFKKEKVSIADLYTLHENILDRILQKLDNFLWHKFETVIFLYDKVFDVKINLGFFISKRDIRHDIVHRNGKKQTINTDIEYNNVTDIDVKDMISEVVKVKDQVVNKLNIDKVEDDPYAIKVTVRKDTIEELKNSMKEIWSDKQDIPVYLKSRSNPIYPEKDHKKYI